MTSLLASLGVRLPIVQAPMAGTSTPAMAAAVTEAGGLGSIAVGALDAERAARAIAETRAATRGPFNVNVFCHAPARRDAACEREWLERLGPVFEGLGGRAPTELGEIYESFLADEAMLEVLIEARPKVVSFHFGLPPPEKIAKLKAAGIVLFSTATNLSEASQAKEAGVDAIVAQGWEAGGHRGVFHPGRRDPALGLLPLTQALVREVGLPVVAAGGIMDGAGIAAALALGAEAAQLGTAFIGCPESSADVHHRRALFGPNAAHTEMTRIISGRPARCLRNELTALRKTALRGAKVPAYPVAYDAGKQLNAVAKAAGKGGFGAQWAGQGAPLAREMPAGELVQVLAGELAEARAKMR